MSKKILAFILTVAMVCSLCVPALAEDTQGVTFADAKGNWAESSINRWAAAGIITGDTNGNVNPGQFLTRAELATILVRFLGLTEKAPADTFSDVAADAWYADAVLKCAAAGIMQGWAGKADPNDPITREQAITMVGRALGVKAQAGQNLSKFEDADKVSAYATEYMAPLTAMGILSGIEDGSKVAPQNNIDRASALALLDKAIAAYVTAPGTVKAEDANKFVIVNASAGDVTVSGVAAGVLVTNGNKANVKLNNLTADTVKVDSAVAVDVSNNSKLGAMDVNAPASVTVDRGSKVSSIDTTDAPSANVSNNQSSGGSSGGGGGGGGSVTGKTYAVAVDTKIVNGTVTVSTKNARVGATVTVTAKANDGYVVSDDTVTVTAQDGTKVAVTKGTNGRFTFKMPAQDVTVTATFKKDTTTPVEPDKTYTVTVDTTVNGTVTADKATAKAGETVTLTVTPATGYELDTLTVNGQAVTGTTFVMPAANVTVAATFKAVTAETTYTVTDQTAADANGTLEISKASGLKKNDTVTITVKPAAGYELDKFTVDGVEKTVTGTTYTLTIGEANVTVKATFKATIPSVWTFAWDDGFTNEVAATGAFKGLTLSGVVTENDGTTQVGKPYAKMNNGTGSIGVPVTGKCNVEVTFFWSANATIGVGADTVPGTANQAQATAVYHYGTEAAGTVTITNVSGTTYVEKIEIKPYTAPETMLVLGADKATIDLKTSTTTAEVTAEVKYGTTDNKIVYTIADDTVVSAVYADGKIAITGLKAGETTITVTVSGTSLSQTITVTVLSADVGELEAGKYVFSNKGEQSGETVNNTNGVVSGLTWTGLSMGTSGHGVQGSGSMTVKVPEGKTATITIVTCGHGNGWEVTSSSGTVTSTDTSEESKTGKNVVVTGVTGEATITFGSSVYVHMITVELN